jgi:hypothetical protein
VAPAIGGPAKLRGSTGTTAIIERRYSSAVSESVCGRNSSGSFAILAAIRRASSRELSINRNRTGKSGLSPRAPLPAALVCQDTKSKAARRSPQRLGGVEGRRVTARLCAVLATTVAF